MKKKNIQNITAALVMTALVTAVLLTSFQLAIYGDPEFKFYQREYEKYQVADALDMKMSDIMDVTEHMMAYLIGEQEELSVITTVEGRTQDFFNEQDRFHMSEVKALFLGGLRIRNILVLVVVAGILILKSGKARLGQLLPKAYLISLGIFVLATAVLAVLFSSDFNKYFTIFHEIFFDNDLWMFDPATDYMIRMLPEGFFYDFVFRICGYFVGILAGLGAVSVIWKKADDKRK